MANDNQFSIMAIAALKEKTDNRKAKAIELYNSGKGLRLEAIAKQLGTSTRTVRRYLPDVNWRGNTK